MTKPISLTFAIAGIVFVAVPALAAPASGLQFNAIGEILYDSNQLRISGGGVQGPNERHREDFRYSPALNAEYVRAVGRSILTVDALVGRDFHQYNRFLNRNHIAGGGSFSYRASSCSAVVTGNYSERQNGIRDSAIATPPESTGTVPPDDIGRLIDNLQIAANYGISANCGSGGGRLSFGGGAQHSQLHNVALARQFADSNSDTYSLFTGIGVLRPGQLQLNGSYSVIGYPNRLGTPGLVPPPFGINSGVKTYRVGLSFTRPIGTKLTGTIGVSYLTARPTGGQSPYSSPAYDVSLSYVPGNRFTFVVLGSRNIIASSTVGALFRVVDVIQLNGTYQISNSISTHANAGFINNNYKQSFATVGQVARRNDATKIIGVGVSYAPRPLYDVNFLVSESFRNSNPSLFNYNSTKASVTFAIHI